MVCYWRTVAYGLGVCSASYILASLSWPLLLAGFAMVSVVLAAMSWINDGRAANKKPQLASVSNFKNGPRTRSKRSVELYQFPMADMSLNQNRSI